MGKALTAADINTRAYENVKNTWTKRGIWNKRWGILPGMSWKHEEPLEEEAADGPVPVPANPLVNGSHEAGEAPAIRIFGSPPPVESNHRQASGALNSSQQGPRRSKRIKPPIHGIAKDSKNTTRSKSMQNIADNMTAKSSAKPQGISKRPSAKTTRRWGKARKE